jgi:tetratricopeptide (TPR) repeat protein
MSKYKKPVHLTQNSRTSKTIPSTTVPGTSLDSPTDTPTCGGGFIKSKNPSKHLEKISTPEPLITDLKDENSLSLDSLPNTPLRRLSLEAFASSTPSPGSLDDLNLNDTQQGGLVYHYKQGTNLYSQQKYLEAIKQFDQALKIDDRYANAHYNKALALKALGKLEESMIEHEKALALKPQNILYLCSKGKLHLNAHEHAPALKCFQDAYLASSSDTPTASLSEKNQEFIRQMLLERSKLLEHIANLQAASIENQKIIDAYQDHPAFRSAVKHFLSLKQDKTELIEKCIHNLHPSSHQTSLDLGAPPEEIISQLQSSPKDHKQSKLVQTLYNNIHTLSEKLASLEQKFLHQQKELSKLSEEQEYLQDKTVEQDLMLEQQAEDIQRLEKLAKSLEINQQGLKALIKSLEEKGAHNTEKLLEEIAELKHNLAAILPEDLDLDEYQTGFFQTLRQDLVASQSAANLVTNSNIIRNSKTGTAGRVGDILDIAGDIIPSFGGYIQFFAAIINTADHYHQQQLVSKLANIATTPIEMEKIAYSIAKILSDPKYFDKTLIESGPQSLKTKIVNYLCSFVEELADGSQSSNTNTSSAVTKGHDAHTKPENKKYSIFRKTKSFSDSSAQSPADEKSREHSSCKLFFFPRKSKTGSADEEASRLDSEATSSTKSIDFLQRSRDLSEERLHADDSRALHSKKSFSLFRKHTKSSPDSSSESIDSVLSTEETKGINNAHLISSIIISAIYQGQVPPRGFHTHTDDVIAKILEVVFVKLDLSTEKIPEILSKELTDEPEASVKTETGPSPILNKKQEAKKIATEILEEIKKQIDLPETLNNSALHAISSRIATCYSSNKTSIIESMMESSIFKSTFIDRLTVTLIDQIKTSGNLAITLDSVRTAIKTTEATIRAEGDEFSIDRNPTELLDWSLKIEHTPEAYVITGDSIEYSTDHIA